MICCGDGLLNAIETSLQLVIKTFCCLKRYFIYSCCIATCFILICHFSTMLESDLFHDVFRVTSESFRYAIKLSIPSSFFKCWLTLIGFWTLHIKLISNNFALCQHLCLDTIFSVCEARKYLINVITNFDPLMSIIYIYILKTLPYHTDFCIGKCNLIEKNEYLSNVIFIIPWYETWITNIIIEQNGI